MIYDPNEVITLLDNNDNCIANIRIPLSLKKEIYEYANHCQIISNNKANQLGCIITSNEIIHWNLESANKEIFNILNDYKVGQWDEFWSKFYKMETWSTVYNNEKVWVLHGNNNHYKIDLICSEVKVQKRICTKKHITFLPP
jgi:hypothetical protein